MGHLTLLCTLKGKSKGRLSPYLSP